MIYLKFINAIMKIRSQAIRVSFWAILGIAILLTNLALNRIQQTLQESTATLVVQTGTADATAEVDPEAGSTDGIMLVALVIVLVVILPILLKRQEWENGKKNKPPPPR